MWSKKGENANERTTLLSANNKNNDDGELPASPSSYYFLRKGVPSEAASVRDADGGEVIEIVPDGATGDDFASRPVHQRKPSFRAVQSKASQPNIWSKIFGGKKNNSNGRQYGEIGTLHRERKVPVKIEPKVFFANERTFLAWLHAAVLLAGASVAIVAFADENPWSQVYGIVLLPVSIAFICYAMYQYARRSSMIRRKDPGPYEDTVGPTVLGIMLMVSIVAQFAIKVYTMM